MSVIEIMASSVRQQLSPEGKRFDDRLNGAWSQDIAKASIAVLREAGYAIVPRDPTDAMLERGGNEGGFDGYRAEDNTADIWRAMIDAGKVES